MHFKRGCLMRSGNNLIELILMRIALCYMPT